MEKIAVYNNKGGTGKSTLAVQIAHGLAQLDYRTILIDLDDQNDCSLYLGIQQNEKTFFDLIDYRYPASLDECIVNARPNLDLLQNSNFEMIEKDFHRETNIDKLLEDKLSQLEDKNYDYCIFDCSPSRGIVNTAILYYVNHIIVPLLTEPASIKGLSNIYSYLEDLKISKDKISLIVPSMYDQRTKEAKENLKELQDIFKEQGILTEPIHRRTKIVESSKAGLTIFEYDDVAQQQFYEVIQRVVRDIA